MVDMTPTSSFSISCKDTIIKLLYLLYLLPQVVCSRYTKHDAAAVRAKILELIQGELFCLL